MPCRLSRRVWSRVSSSRASSKISSSRSDAAASERLDRLYASLDRVRDRFGHSAVVAGRSIALMGKLEQDGYGFVLRTPSLTR